MRCNEDCLNCQLPVEKCRGGSGKSATKWMGATKDIKKSKGFGAVHVVGGTGRIKGNRRRDRDEDGM